jgi:predicted permease
MKKWIVRAALRLVPADWRASVDDDVADAALAENRGALWIALQTARIGFRMRAALAIDAGRFDLAHGLRSLGRAPWFTCGAVLTFALGIGVNIAVFTAVDRALFRQLPYDRPNELVVMRELDGSGRQFGTMPAAIAVAAREHHRGLVDLSVSGFTRSFAFSRDPDSGTLRLTTVTHNTLGVFGVHVMRGRDFAVEDAANARLALISFDAWKHRFGATEDIIGRRIYEWPGMNSVEIIGVLPKAFIPPSSFLNPLSDGLVLDPNTLTNSTPDARLFPPYARLRPGVSVQAAQAELDALVESQRDLFARSTSASRLRIQLVPLRSVLFDRYSNYLWLIVGAASLVLAIACANLGSLMLVRNRSREHLAATQMALGASGWRLMRAGLIETALLSIGGTVLSLLAINWSDAALRAVVPPVFSRYAVGAADARVLMFALFTAVVCTVAAGVYPSWRISRVDVLPLLQRGAGSPRAGRLRGSRGLLAVEAAVGVMLVTGAATTVRSFATLTRTDLGFEPNNLYRVSVGWPNGVPGAQFEQTAGIVQALNSAPGVTSAAAVDINPLSGAIGMNALGPGLKGTSRWRVTSGFFDTMKMRLIAGRQFSLTEVADDAPVGMLSESGLRLVWPGIRAGEAIGRRLHFTGEPDREVVGVVTDIRSAHEATPIPSLYLPLSAYRFRQAEFIIRVASGTTPVSADVRNRVRQSGVPVASVNVGNVTGNLLSALGDQRFRAVLFSAFGVTALVLAALGLYAVGSYEVARREREIGIRLAIGGSAGAVQWLMLREMLSPVIVGIIAGLAGTYWSAAFLQSFLYQVDARDPATLAVAILVLLASATMAAWVPTHRAARLDPAAVLRSQ